MRTIRAWLLTGGICGALAGALGACSSSDGGQPSGGDAGSPDTGVPVDSGGGDGGGGDATGAQPTADLQILNISDWHGQLDPVSETDANGESQTFGGVPVLSAYFTQEKAKQPNTLVLTAGDEFGATPALSGFNDDKPAVASLNLLGLAADTFGNHNFDHGMDFLKARMDEATYPFVSTNLKNVVAELGAKPVQPFALIDVGAAAPKVKVAVLGITNPDAPSLLLPGALKTITIDEPIAAANDAAKKARQAGAHIVVVLAHLGAEAKDGSGNPTGPLLDFAKGVQGVDVILGDHTDFVVNTTVNGTLVTENRSKGRTYTTVKLHVENGALTTKSATTVDPAAVVTAHLTDPNSQCGGAAPQPACRCVGSVAPATDIACPAGGFTCQTTSGKCTKNAIDPDAAAIALLKPYRDALATKFDAKAAQIQTQLPGDKPTLRTKEAALGDLVADAMLDRYKGNGAQIAFTNAGGIRDSFPSSYAPQDQTLHRPVTPYNTAPPFDLVIGDVYTILPFGNVCVMRKVTGDLLWQVLEKSVAADPAQFGGFLQISGFKYTYNSAAAAGSRIVSVTLLDGSTNGKDIPKGDPTEYVAVTNDFTNAGGDGYAMLVQPQAAPKLDVMADVFLDYVKKQALGGVLNPTIAGRVTRQ